MGIVKAFIVMSAEQHAEGNSLNDANVELGGRKIDNPLSDNLGWGSLVGKYVVGAQLLNDQAYARWVPTLGTYPIHVLDTDTLFIPDEA